jgi:hypothetical protein
VGSNQVWAAEVTCIFMNLGFKFLVVALKYEVLTAKGTAEAGRRIRWRESERGVGRKSQ